MIINQRNNLKNRNNDMRVLKSKNQVSAGILSTENTNNFIYNPLIRMSQYNY